MKKIIFVVALASCAVSTFAQLSLGGYAGFNGGLYTEKPKVNNTAILPTFHLGVAAEYGFSELLSLQSGLQLNGRGTSIEHQDHHDDLGIYTLDIPVLVTLRKSGFFIAAGPALSVALAGSAHSHDASGAEKEDEIKFGNNPGELKRTSFNVQIKAGYELNNGIFIQGGYLADLTNWSNVSGATTSFPLFQVGIGYRLKFQ
jgi:hypothetical protein